MTSITIGGPRETGPAVAEPAPLPTGGLVARAADLLGEAAGLPQPGYVTVSATQHISLQFAPDRGSFAAITGWALRFGGVVASERREDGEIGCHLEFAYQGVTVGAYAYIPAAQPAT